MDTESAAHEPLEDLVDQDENAIERSLELLLAGLAGSLPIDRDMDLEVQQQASPNEVVNTQDEDRNDSEEDEIPRIEGDIEDKAMSPAGPTYRVQVVVPEISLEERAQYSTVHSDIVEFVFGEVPKEDHTTDWRVAFTDGRNELVGGSSSIQRAISFIWLFSRVSIVSMLEGYSWLLFCSSDFGKGNWISELLSIACPIHCRPEKYTPSFSSPASPLLISRLSCLEIAFSPNSSLCTHFSSYLQTTDLFPRYLRHNSSLLKTEELPSPGTIKASDRWISQICMAHGSASMRLKRPMSLNPNPWSQIAWTSMMRKTKSHFKRNGHGAYDFAQESPLSSSLAVLLEWPTKTSSMVLS